MSMIVLYDYKINYPATGTYVVEIKTVLFIFE